MKIKRDNKAEKFLKALTLGVVSLSFVLAVSITLRATIDDEDNTNIESSSIVETTTGTTSTTLTTTTTTSTTTSTTSTSTTTTTTTTTTEETTTTTYDFKERLIDYGYFTGSYYHGEYTNPCPGGSGRMLEDCTPNDNEIKGSVACKFIQSEYGYNVNGRTRVYLEIDGYPDMNGWYWVDDACESYSVVDFYFINYSSCPWEHDGLSRVHLWMEMS